MIFITVFADFLMDFCVKIFEYGNIGLCFGCIGRYFIRVDR